MTKPDENLLAVIEEANARPALNYETISVEEARMASIESSIYWNAKRPPVARIKDFSLTGAFGDRPARLYDNAPSNGIRPGIFYLHGGGFVVGSLDSHDVVCDHLAIKTGFPVISYDYVLAPEYPFPRPVDDANQALLSLIKKADELQIDPSCLGVAGDSAGAALAFNNALYFRDQGLTNIKAALLIYPCASADVHSESFQLYGAGEHYLLSTAAMRWFYRHYFEKDEDYLDPRAELIDARLDNLPPVMTVVAGLDPLKDGAVILDQRIKQYSKESVLLEYPSMVHGFAKMFRRLPQSEQLADEASQFLNFWLRQA